MNRVQRPGGAHAWLLALAVAAVALLFAWIVVPAVLIGSPLADALQKPFEMGGSLIAAMAVIGALKLYLERPIQAGAPLEFDPSPSKANRKIATKKQSTPAAQYERSYASQKIRHGPVAGRAHWQMLGDRLGSGWQARRYTRRSPAVAP